MEQNFIKGKFMIVFSGFNQRAVIAFLRTLEKHKIQYGIVAKSHDDEVFLTNYKSKVVAVRKSTILSLEDLLDTIRYIQVKNKAREYVIAPTTEALNRYLLNFRKEFEKIQCVVPLVGNSLYESISDKYSFSNICLKNNILVPNEIHEDFVEYPIVAKPRKYLSAKDQIISPIILYSYEEFNKFINIYDLKDFYFQKFISGKSLYLLYYFHRNGSIFKYSQENLVQQPQGKSMLAAIASDFHHSLESKKYEKLFKNIDFFGLVMVEVKQEKNKYYMIEANPRFWGPSQLFVDAGMNFFEIFLHDYGFLDDPPKFIEPTRPIKYFWLGGVIESLNKKQKLVYHQYNENLFNNSLSEWLEVDLYARDDTSYIFKKENFNELRKG